MKLPLSFILCGGIWIGSASLSPAAAGEPHRRCVGRCVESDATVDREEGRLARDLRFLWAHWALQNYFAQAQFDRSRDAVAPPQSVDEPTRRDIPVASAPEIDETRLNPQQLQLWRDLRTRFRFSAAAVQASLTALEQLSARLAERGMSLNPQHASTAALMQRSIAEAVEAMRVLDFPAASAAIERADYARYALKDVAGR